MAVTKANAMKLQGIVLKDVCLGIWEQDVKKNVQITSMDEDVQKLAVQCACKEIVSATMVHVNLVVHPDSEDENAMKNVTLPALEINVRRNVTAKINLKDVTKSRVNAKVDAKLAGWERIAKNHVMITNLAINVQSHADVETKKKLVTRKREDAEVAVRQDGVVKIVTEIAAG